MPIRDIRVKARGTVFNSGITYANTQVQGNSFASIINIVTGSATSLDVLIYPFDHLAHLPITGSGPYIHHTQVTPAVTGQPTAVGGLTQGFQEMIGIIDASGSGVSGMITPFVQCRYVVSGSGGFTGSHLIIDKGW